MKSLPQSLRNGLILHAEAPLTGATWVNQAGSQNGTATNSPTTVRRLQHQGASFNGSNQLVNFGTFPIIATTQELTLCCRIELPSFSNGTAFGFHTGGSSTASISSFFARPTGISFEVSTGASQVSLVTLTRQTGGVSECVISVKNGNVRAYVNGTLIASSTATGINFSTATTTALSLGGSNTNNEYSTIRAFSPMLWSRALSDAEVALLYNSNFIT